MVEDTKISFIDIYVFIQKSWKTVLAFALLGLISAAIFLLLTPKQYEALAQIKMAQLSIPNNDKNSNDKTLGINIEEPRALILRMRLPTVYDQEAISSCGLIDKPNANQLLANKVKLTIPKEVSGVVDLKIREFSVESAKVCANAVFILIKKSQANMMAPYIQEATQRLNIDKENLTRATQLIERADKSGTTASAVYLATRDEIRYLLDQINGLQKMITNNQDRAASLTAPIYSQEQAVFPSIPNSLLAGLFVGCFLGGLFCLFQQWYQSNRNALRRY